VFHNENSKSNWNLAKEKTKIRGKTHITVSYYITGLKNQNESMLCVAINIYYMKVAVLTF
jgi:hypothetical protein